MQEGNNNLLQALDMKLIGNKYCTATHATLFDICTACLWLFKIEYYALSLCIEAIRLTLEQLNSNLKWFSLVFTGNCPTMYGTIGTRSNLFFKCQTSKWDLPA